VRGENNHCITVRGENFHCITVSTESRYSVLDRNIAEVEYTTGVIETITNENDSIASWFMDNASVKKLHLVQIKSTVTDMNYICNNCTSMIEFTCSADTSNVTSMQGAWEWCSSLTSFPSIDTSSVIMMQSAWSDCTSLTSFPYINNIKSTNIYDMYETWANCTLLTSHGGLASCTYVTIDTFNNTPVKPCGF